MKCREINNAPVFQKSTTKIAPLGSEEVGSKIIYTIEVDKSMYEKINQVEKQLMIIILARKPSPAPSIYALEYSNLNQVRLLREGRAFEDKVKRD